VSQLEMRRSRNLLRVVGCFHYDEIGYLWKNFLTPEIKPGSIEDLSIRRFVRLWTNFAKYGNPTPDKNDKLLNVIWKPVTSKDLDMLEIGYDLVACKSPETKRMEFWDKLYKESPAGRKSRALVSKM
jgi:carboxylesterase type B